MDEEGLSMTLRCQQWHLRKSNWTGSFDFALPRGEWLSILGESGAGKSSLLESMMGLLAPQAGSLWFDDQELTKQPPSQRPMAMVFQHNALLAHLSIEKNLLLCLHDFKLSKRQKRQWILQQFEDLQLAPACLARYPHQVSGGELARLNLCAAFLRHKPILLLDEPFSSLNEAIKAKLLALLKEIQQKKNMTIICVTHDLRDVLPVADRLLLVHKGMVMGYDRLHTLIAQPPRRDVAEYLNAGSLYWHAGDARLYFIRPYEFATSAASLESEAAVREIKLTQSELSWCVQGVKVEDKATNCTYTLSHAQGFHGKLYFDARKVWCLPADKASVQDRIF